jgi:MFS family permease
VIKSVSTISSAVAMIVTFAPGFICGSVIDRFDRSLRHRLILNQYTQVQASWALCTMGSSFLTICMYLDYGTLFWTVASFIFGLGAGLAPSMDLYASNFHCRRDATYDTTYTSIRQGSWLSKALGVVLAHGLFVSAATHRLRGEDKLHLTFFPTSGENSTENFKMHAAVRQGLSCVFIVPAFASFLGGTIILLKILLEGRMFLQDDDEHHVTDAEYTLLPREVVVS